THVLAPGARLPAVARFGILPPPAGKVLPDGTYLSELRGRGTSERMPVRGIEYTITTTSLGPDGAVEGTPEVFCLIATLLDPVHAPAGELAVLLDQRNGGHTATLRSNSLVLGEHERWAMLCGYQVLRHLTADTGSGGGARADPLHHVGVRYRPSRSGGTTARPTRPPA
ncbi:hypothetical protein ACFRH8_33500, partial [Streptomyces sp. NPDC056707]